MIPATISRSRDVHAESIGHILIDERISDSRILNAPMLPPTFVSESLIAFVECFLRRLVSMLRTSSVGCSNPVLLCPMDLKDFKENWSSRGSNWCS